MEQNAGIRIREPYSARSIRFTELWSHGDWRVKVYGIGYRRRGPGARLEAAARRLAAGCLPEPAVTESRYGVAFMGVHEGRGENLVFVDWWAEENELRHHVFVSPQARPADLVDVTRTSRIGCVWDLAVIAFERRAWIDAVLLDVGRPDLDRYLACRFDGLA